ncbi:MAG: amino acid permease [Elusimicrobiota bacterium]|jgi:amino acid transporter|nr:amino acid permease [Elusimicrobiota bacterium]
MNPDNPASTASLSKGPAGKTQHFFRVRGVAVLATAMLTFIPFWKAAAIVLCDFGSSAFYAGGIAMRAFGPAFPWYILGVMLFSGLLLMMYIETCALFTRGGIFPVVNAGLGETAAKAATAAILFDFALTGPISGISAGYYLSGLINSVLEYCGAGFAVPHNALATIFAIGVCIYFWYQNIKGIEDSSDKSSIIIQFSIAVCFILLVFAVITLMRRGSITLPPFMPDLEADSLGFAANTDLFKKIGYIGVLVAFGHSVLAMSGLETLAQVYREIEYPKIKNLKMAALIIFVFAFVFTGGLTFLASLIIPQDLIAGKYAENLLSGLAMHVDGPLIVKLALQGLVVTAGVLMLSGAVNTSIIGANGIMSRMAETGILTDWFRKIHRRYGTTYHTINIICIAQIAVILLSRGEIYLIGQAYAFGVLWSFVFEVISIISLRFKNYGQKREFMMPFNIKWGHYYVPVGGFFVALAVVALASVNLITKKVATISGFSFAAALFIFFHISGRLNAKKANDIFEEGHRERLNRDNVPDLKTALAGLEGKNRILVAVRSPDNLYHLDAVLKSLNDDDTDVVVMYAKPVNNWRVGKTEGVKNVDDNKLFSNVVLLAEKYGHVVYPLMISSNDPFYAISQVAMEAHADEIIMGVSGSHGANEQLERLVMAWGALRDGKEAGARRPITAKILWEGREVSYKF